MKYLCLLSLLTLLACGGGQNADTHSPHPISASAGERPAPETPTSGPNATPPRNAVQVDGMRRVGPDFFVVRCETPTDEDPNAHENQITRYCGEEALTQARRETALTRGHWQCRPEGRCRASTIASENMWATELRVDDDVLLAAGPGYGCDVTELGPAGFAALRERLACGVETGIDDVDFDALRTAEPHR